jgi:hypothetical protein
VTDRVGWIALAHLLDSAVIKDSGRDVARFNDRIWTDPDFVDLPEGGLVLTLERVKTSISERRWVLRRVFRVSLPEYRDDTPEYYLSLESDLSPSVSGTRHEVSEFELIREHSWSPGPEDFFKPFPTVVWNWLREVKHVPLPVPRPFTVPVPPGASR